jgi:hypothetical protein
MSPHLLRTQAASLQLLCVAESLDPESKHLQVLLHFVTEDRDHFVRLLLHNDGVENNCYIYAFGVAARPHMSSYTHGSLHTTSQARYIAKAESPSRFPTDFLKRSVSETDCSFYTSTPMCDETCGNHSEHSRWGHGLGLCTNGSTCFRDPCFASCCLPIGPTCFHIVC